MHQRDCKIAFFLSCILLFSGCGGGNSDQPVVPLLEEYYTLNSLGTQEVTHRIQYDYSTPLQIESHYLAPGEDGLWGTGDDIRSPYLLCRYAVDPNNLPYQRFLRRATTRGPSSATDIIAGASATSFNGRTPLCPSVKGHYLQYMELCPGSHCPRPYSSNPFSSSPFLSLQLTVSRERQGDTLIDTQSLLSFFNGIADAGLPEIQETRIVLDEKGRPTSIDINTPPNAFNDLRADACMEDKPILYNPYRQDCDAFRQSIRYRYKHDGIFRETDYYQVWDYSFMTKQQRVIDEDAKTLTINTTGSLSDRRREHPEHIFTFNDQKKVTSFQISLPGDHNDQALKVLEYSYNDKNKIRKMKTNNGNRYEYFYDEKNRLQEVSMRNTYRQRQTLFTYNSNHRSKKSTYIQLPQDQSEPVKTSKTDYQLAPQGSPFDFRSDEPYISELTLEDVLNIFDMPSIDNSMD